MNLIILNFLSKNNDIYELKSKRVYSSWVYFVSFETMKQYELGIHRNNTNKINEGTLIIKENQWFVFYKSTESYIPLPEEIQKYYNHWLEKTK